MAVLKAADQHERAVYLTAFCAGFVVFGLLYAPQPILHLFSKSFDVLPHVSSLTVSLPLLLLALAAVLMVFVRGRVALDRVVPLAILAAAVTNMIAVLATSWTMLMIARGLTGILIGLVPASIMSVVTASVRPARMGRAMSWYITGCGCGSMTGRLLAGFVSEAYGYQAALATISLMAFGIGVFLWFRFRSGGRSDPAAILRTGFDGAAFHKALSTPAAMVIYLLAFVLMSSFAGVFNYLSYLLSSTRLGLSEASLTLGFLPLAVGTFSAPIIGRLFDRWGPRRMLGAAFSLVILGALLSMFTSLVALFIGLSLIALGAFAGHASASATLGQVPGIERTYASSLYMFFYYSGASVTGFISGILYAHGGWDWTALATAALSGIGLALTLAMIKRNTTPNTP